jgi:putative ABC transport system permease protein
VGFFADRVGKGLVRDAHQLLGADLVLASDHPWKAQMQEEIRARGLEAAAAVNFISMAFGGDKSQLAAVKGGHRELSVARPLARRCGAGAPDAQAERGPRKGTVWLEERLVSAHDAPVGSRVRLGKRRASRWPPCSRLEPERSAQLLQHRTAAPDEPETMSPPTGLIRTGSRVSYYCMRPCATTNQRARGFRETPVGARPARRQSRDRVGPRCAPRLERARRFLALTTALLAAVLAGVAIALGTRRFCRASPGRFAR